MSDPVEALVLDLLEWVGDSGKSYADVMAAWRTSCPRLPVWEEANERGLVIRENTGSHVLIRLTPKGQALLQERQSN